MKQFSENVVPNKSRSFFISRQSAMESGMSGMPATALPSQPGGRTVEP
jgi:hypothetical protein